MAPTRTGGSLLVDALVAAGTTDIFALCGNHVLPVAESLRSRDLRVVAGRSEAAMVFAADAYGRVARRPGVALVSGGPGLANTVTALATARGNRSPVVVVSGEPDTAGVGRGAQQEIPHQALMAAVTKWSRSVTRVDHLGSAVAEACRVARTGTPGPVSLSVPLDALRAAAGNGPVDVPAPMPTVGVAPDPFVEATVAALEGAERPVVVAGAGVWQGGGEGGLDRLAHRTNIPVLTLDSARGAASDEAPSGLGSADSGLNAAARLLPEADVVVIVGRAVDFRLDLGGLFTAARTVVHVDSELSSLGRNLSSPRCCLADPSAFVLAVARRLPNGCGTEAWRRRLQDARAEERTLVAREAGLAGSPAHPAAVAEVLGQVGNDAGAAFAVDCGEFAQWCRQVIPVTRPGSWLRLGPQATCGAGLPFGLGARVARPGQPTLVIAGDGGLGYHIAELETSVREGAPVVVVVGHDDGWGIERNLQEGIYGAGHDYATRLSRSSWTAVASGFGADAVAVEDVTSLGDAVKAALGGDRTTLVEIPVRTVPSRVTKKMIERERRGEDGMDR